MTIGNEWQVGGRLIGGSDLILPNVPLDGMVITDDQGRTWVYENKLWQLQDAAWTFLWSDAASNVMPSTVNMVHGMEPGDVLVLFTCQYNCATFTFTGLTTARQQDVWTGDYYAMRYRICDGTETFDSWQSNWPANDGIAWVMSHWRPKTGAAVYRGQAGSTGETITAAAISAQEDDLIITCWGGWNNSGYINNSPGPPYMVDGAYVAGEAAWQAYQIAPSTGTYGPYTPSTYPGGYEMSGQIAFGLG